MGAERTKGTQGEVKDLTTLKHVRGLQLTHPGNTEPGPLDPGQSTEGPTYPIFIGEWRREHTGGVRRTL